MLHGKELSYNNLLDLDSALRLVRQFAEPAACDPQAQQPLRRRRRPRPWPRRSSWPTRAIRVSAFGGIVGLNRPVDRATAERMCVPGRFLEAILAPGFDDDALELLTTKPTWKNSVRLLDLGAPIGPDDPPPAGFDLRRIEGGLLVQDWDATRGRPGRRAPSPTRRAPTDAERARPGLRLAGLRRRSSRTRSCWRRAGSSSASAPAR